jgi:hypothetical protein
MRKFIKVAGSSIAVSIFFIAEKALAAPTTANVSPLGSDLPSIVRTLFGWAVALSGLIFVVMFLVGGIQYLTSAGNEEASTKAKKLLIDAVIGIIIVAIAWVAGNWVLKQLGIESSLIVQ